MNPFDYLNSINYSKKDLMTDDITESNYNSYIINRGLSYFADTVAMANMMNQYHHLDNLLQYHFLINIVRKKKRFSKWNKPKVATDLEVIKEYYGYSNEKARMVHNLLTDNQITELRKKVFKGGRK
tara:strand:+ start:1173 stop:1550 length:378 start_codon:yes stop_codon:yes gene_type:complete